MDGGMKQKKLSKRERREKFLFEQWLIEREREKEEKRIQKIKRKKLFALCNFDGHNYIFYKGIVSNSIELFNDLRREAIQGTGKQYDIYEVKIKKML